MLVAAHTGDEMRKAIAGVFLLLPIAPALAQNHPDTSRYEYAVSAARGNYPPEAERTYWSCYDSASKVSVACSYVRGENIKKFDYVYRQLQGNPQDDRPGQLQKCTALHSDALARRTEVARSLRGSDVDNACGEVTNAKRSLDLGRSALSAYESFKRQCGQVMAGLGDDVSSYQSQIQAAERKLVRYSRYCDEDRDDRAGRTSRQNTESPPSRERRQTTPSEEFGPTDSGKIDCFGGCGPSQRSPAGSQSTITNRKWGDVPKGGGGGGTTTAR
jgi:hypothetical protein